MSFNRTRRRILAAIGGATVGLAGCSGSEGNGTRTSTTTSTTEPGDDGSPGGDESTDESTDEPGEPETEGLADAEKGLDDAVPWLVTPDALGFDQIYYPQVGHPRTVARRGATAFDCDVGFEVLTPKFLGPDDAVSVDDVEMIVQMASQNRGGIDRFYRVYGVSVATGDFDLSGVLPNEDYESAGTYGGFSRFDSTRLLDGEPDHVLAVRDGTVIFSNVDEAWAAIEAVIDAYDGNGVRLSDRNPAVETVANELDDVTTGHVIPVPEHSDLYDDGLRAWGIGQVLGESRTIHRGVAEFASPAAVDRELGKGIVSPTNGEFADLQVQTDGSQVTGEAMADSADVQEEFVNVPLSEGPHVRLQLTYDGSTLTVFHEGGDTISLNKLVISYNSTERRLDRDGALSAGGSIDVDLPDLSSGDTVEVVWRPECAASGTVLARHTVEE